MYKNQQSIHNDIRLQGYWNVTSLYNPYISKIRSCI